MGNVASETNFNSGYFEINGTNMDSKAPVIDADTVKYSMQQATVGDIVTVSLKITDDGEIDYASIELQNMDTNYILLERCLMTYNEVSGLYEYQFKITDEIPNGRWRLSVATVCDKASNYSRETNFGDNYFEVTGTNADFIAAKLPHLHEIITDDIDEIASWCEVMVITNKEKEFGAIDFINRFTGKEKFDFCRDIQTLELQLPKAVEEKLEYLIEVL